MSSSPIIMFKFALQTVHIMYTASRLFASAGHELCVLMYNNNTEVQKYYVRQRVQRTYKNKYRIYILSVFLYIITIHFIESFSIRFSLCSCVVFVCGGNSVKPYVSRSTFHYLI